MALTTDYVVTRFIQQGVGGLNSDLGRIAGNFYVLERRMDDLSRSSVRAITMGTIGVGMVINLAKRSAEAAGQVERVEVGFTSVLRNVQLAQEYSKKIRDFDVKTPFSYLETAHGAQMLVAAGFRNDLIPTMYAVGNAIVAAGKGTEYFNNGLAIMARIKSTGYLTSRQVIQFASIGVNLKDILKKQLGLTDEQMIDIGRLHLKADVVIPALVKGMNEQFGGAIEKAGQTMLGSLEILKGQTDKMFASIGKDTNPLAVPIIHTLTNLTDAITTFNEQHPKVTAMGVALVGIGSSVLALRGVYNAIMLAKMARVALTNATRTDIAAEAEKAVVAGVETRALTGGANAANYSAGMAMRLANANAAAAMATDDIAAAAAAAGAGATTATPRFIILRGILQSVRGFMAKPLLNSSEESATVVADIANLEGKLASSRAGYLAVSGSAIRQELAAAKSYYNILGALGGRGIQQLGGASVTIGGALAGGAQGILGGIEDYQNYKAAGYDNSVALPAGVGTGIAEAVVAWFVPGGIIAEAVGHGAALGINKFYNEPAEAAAMAGDGLGDEVLKRTAGDHRARADAYLKQADELRRNRSDYSSGVGGSDNSQQEAEIDQAMSNARHEMDIDRAEKRSRAAEVDRQRNASYGKDFLAAEAARPGEMIDSRNHRDDSTTMVIRIPERAADRSTRRRNYNSLTPSPSF